jgi:serine/threonine protein kinase
MILAMNTCRRKHARYGIGHLNCWQFTRCRIVNFINLNAIFRFGAMSYGPPADMWSIGCIFAELLLRVPLFAGETELEQLAKIFSIIGTPDEDGTY